jgi:hypothetical protein
VTTNTDNYTNYGLISATNSLTFDKDTWACICSYLYSTTTGAIKTNTYTDSQKLKRLKTRRKHIKKPHKNISIIKSSTNLNTRLTRGLRKTDHKIFVFMYALNCLQNLDLELKTDICMKKSI